MSALFFQSLKGVLAQNGAPGASPDGLRPAGVLVPLCERGAEVTVVLARRSERVPHHKGQICFPGGSRDPGDADLFATALREAGEELGIRRENVELIGAMEPVPTVTGFFIQPYVVQILGETRFSLDDFEMEEVFEVPLSVFAEYDRYRYAETTFLGEEYRVYFFDYGPHTIWGATARILHRLAELVGETPLH
ncbi:MAG: CoA pyrophosphatase [Candidatus Deferrimicrobiaceae bacterium]